MLLTCSESSEPHSPNYTTRMTTSSLQDCYVEVPNPLCVSGLCHLVILARLTFIECLPRAMCLSLAVCYLTSSSQQPCQWARPLSFSQVKKARQRELCVWPSSYDYSASGPRSQVFFFYSAIFVTADCLMFLSFYSRIVSLVNKKFQTGASMKRSFESSICLKLGNECAFKCKCGQLHEERCSP